MRIDILTVVPELLESPLSCSIVGRAIKKGLVDIQVHNLRKYGLGPRKNVDDYISTRLCTRISFSLFTRRYFSSHSHLHSQPSRKLIMPPAVLPNVATKTTVH